MEKLCFHSFSPSSNKIIVSQALESLATHCDAYNEHDSFLVPRQPSNPWISEDTTYWIINAPL